MISVGVETMMARGAETDDTVDIEGETRVREGAEINDRVDIGSETRMGGVEIDELVDPRGEVKMREDAETDELVDLGCEVNMVESTKFDKLVNHIWETDIAVGTEVDGRVDNVGETEMLSVTAIDGHVDSVGLSNMVEDAVIDDKVDSVFEALHEVDTVSETDMAGAEMDKRADIGVEANVTEGAVVAERVDLDEENYMEEIDDDDDDIQDKIENDRDPTQNGDSEKENKVSRMIGDARDQMQADVGSHVSIDNAVDGSKFTPSAGNPDEEKHARLLALPPHGSEIFIGGLPRNATEDDLRDHCEQLGEIFEIRFVKNKDTGESRGYAFITFTTREAAQNAVENLHDKKLKGKAIRCSLSESKYRLFIGNIPKSLTEDEFRNFIRETGPGSENIELIKDPQHSGRNRGFAFVEYYNNACADYSREKMSSENFKLSGVAPHVTWADPKSTADHSGDAPQVKALYVKNIPENTTTEQMKELFQRHGEVTKVVMPPSRSGSGKRDFGFVHYADRSSALKAIKDTKRYEISGQVLDVTLAKPQAEKKSDVPPYSSVLYSNKPADTDYTGFEANTYCSRRAAYGVSPELQQPMIYGMGPMPSGMQMVPMVLPDGRIGYVLQQTGVQIPTSRPRSYGQSNVSGGRQGYGERSGAGDDSNRSRRYRPY